MSFAFNVKINYEDNYGPSWQQIGALLSQEWLPSRIASLTYKMADSYSESHLELVFHEHDNEQFMANLIVQYLVLPDTQDDPLLEVKVKQIDWDGLDKHLSNYWREKLGLGEKRR